VNDLVAVFVAEHGFDVAGAFTHDELYFLRAVRGEPASYFGAGFVDARDRFADAEFPLYAFYPGRQKALAFRGYRIFRPVVDYYLPGRLTG